MHKISNIYTVNEKVIFKSVDIKGDNINTVPELLIEYKHISNLEEQYQIRILSEYKVVISYGNSRSKKYALDTLKKLLKTNKLEYGLIEDGPSFKLRGIIEGFYGTPWSHIERLDVIHFLEKEHMNTYVYAPKNDVYHRSKWREPYPEEDLKILLELINESINNDIDFYFAISPGRDFNYSKEEDFKALFNKIDYMINHGVNHYCLLLDDIDYKLNQEDKTKFSTPGKAHAYICNRLNEHLQSTLKDFKFIMCPTEYYQNFDTPYRQDLKLKLDNNILVFWTGYHTIAEFIPNIDGKNVKEYFGHDLVLWENYPTNDMQPYLLYMGPITNRGNKLDQSHIGMVVNPMGQWNLSKLPLLTTSDYMWNPASYNSSDSYKLALKKICPEDSIRPHLENILENFKNTIIYYHKIKVLEEAISNKQIDILYDYYKELEKDIMICSSMKNKPFLNQLTPWLTRILFDNKIIKYIYNEEFGEAKELLKTHLEKPHAINSNYAVRYSKEIGIYKDKLFKKHRGNNWE
jgi:hyaluronoglucosaminidase